MEMTNKIIYPVVAMVLGMVILFVSITRTGLILLDIDDNKNIRVLPIEFEIDGKKYSYKLPEVQVLPTSSFYSLKRIRDAMWIKSCSDPAEKVQVALLMADKKMSEVIKLSKQGQKELALKGCNEAINKLKYTNKLLNEIDYKNSEIKEIDEQIYKAGFVYKEIIKASCEPLIKEIDDWNKDYKKNTQ